MFQPHRIAFSAILFLPWVTTASARQWSDVTGRYTVEGDLVGFNDQVVVIQRPNKELGAFPIDQLSAEDRKYLDSKEAIDIHTENLGQSQTWTARGGLKLVGRIVDFGRRTVTFQRRRGKTYVNDRVYENLPQLYQLMMPKIVEHFEGVQLASKQAFEDWIRQLRGQPRSYTLDGVILELESGDEYGVPFFLLSSEDQAVLKPGWDAWLAAHDDYQEREDHAFRLQSLAAAYQRDREISRQIAVMNLNLQAIRSGLTSAWEVTLYPLPGNAAPPVWVVALGRNSLEATEMALRQYPGYRSGPVRKISW